MHRIIGADQKEYGPVTGDEVRQWISEGRANAQTPIKDEGSGEWKRLSEHAAFSSLFGAAGHAPVGGTMPPPLPGFAPATAEVPRNNPFAIAGFVCGLAGMVCCGGCLGVPGIILSAIGLHQIGKEPGRFQGRGFGIAGLILSIIATLLSIVILSTFDFQEFLRELENMP